MYQRDDPDSRGYTQGYQTDSFNQRRCKIGVSLIVEQPWSVYETLYHRCFLSSCPFSFHSTLFPSPVTQCSPHPQLSEGDVWLHAFTQCCIWTSESNLIAFIMVIIICHLAVGCTTTFSDFFFFSLSLFFVFYCIFMILNKFCCLGFKAFKNIAATWNELQICRIRSFL